MLEFSKDQGLAVYGVKNVAKLIEQNNIKKLIISENIYCLRVALED